MTPETLAAIQTHALEAYPRESCGLVVSKPGGREAYVRCTNKASTPSEHFVMDHEEFAAIEDQADIVAFVHSHPNATAHPSDADRVSCELHSKPWHIVSVCVDGKGKPPAIAGMQTIEPSGYEAPLVGRSFAHGVLDCYSLCRDWYRLTWGLVIPDFERADNWWLNGQDLYMQHFASAGFRVVSGQPQIGDAFLMQIRSPVVNHAGIYIDEGRGLFLQHFYDRLSTRDVYGGYWREKTRVMIRHESRIP